MYVHVHVSFTCMYVIVSLYICRMDEGSRWPVLVQLHGVCIMCAYMHVSAYIVFSN